MKINKILITLVSVTSATFCMATDFNVPSTISPQAQQIISSFTLAARDRAATPQINDLANWVTWQQSAPSKKQLDQLLNIYQPKLVNRMISGVKVIDIYPNKWQDNHQVIIYLHGGAYTFGSAQGSLISAVPVANDSGLHIISIDYDLAPLYPFPHAINQVVTVYQQLLKQGFRANQIGFFGDSAGGSLVASSILKLQDLKSPLPAVAVLWSPWTDIANIGDSYQTLKNSETAYTYDQQLRNCALAYAPESQWQNPYVSAVYGKFSAKYPPTLIQGGTKEIFLSNFVRLYQNMDQSGVPVKLDLYEGMWHVFQGEYTMPEAIVARKKTVTFIKQHLAK